MSHQQEVKLASTLVPGSTSEQASLFGIDWVLNWNDLGWTESKFHRWPGFEKEHVRQSALPLTTDRNRVLAQTLIEPSQVSAVQLISHT